MTDLPPIPGAAVDASETVPAPSTAVPVPDLEQFREKPKWIPAILATIAIDLAGYAALAYAFTMFGMVDAAGGGSEFRTGVL